MRKHSQRILFLLLSLSLVCLSCFSSLTINAFAEEVESDSYNIDCVPYSQYISNLTVNDNETQVFMRSAYALSATSSTSDTSTDYLYNFHDMWNIFSPDSCNPQGWLNVYTRPEVDGYTYTYYESFDTYNYFKSNKKALSYFKAGNKYHVTFRIHGFNGSSLSWGSIKLSLVDGSNSSNEIVLYTNTVLNSSGGGRFVYNTNFDGNVIIPDTWTGTVCLYLELTSMTGGTYTFGLNDFTVVDITNENLDKSLGKLGDRIEGFFDNLAEKIKGFFIPSDGFFETIQEQFNTLLSEHLGFLYEAPALVTDLFQVISDFEPSEVSYITLPEVDFDIAGTHVHLWDEQVYYFDFLDEQPFSIIYGFYKTLVFVIISIAMINLAINKYHNIIDGGSGDDN